MLHVALRIEEDVIDYLSTHITAHGTSDLDEILSTIFVLQQLIRSIG